MIKSHKDVLEQRSDLSSYIFHLVRSGRLIYRKEVFPQLANDVSSNRTAKERLENIIIESKLRAISAFGYFSYKVPFRRVTGQLINQSSKVQKSWLKAVCFTETPLDHIHIQTQKIIGRNLHFEPYGLAFSEKFICQNGGSPVHYFSSENRSIRNSLDQMAVAENAESYRNIMPYYESFGKRLFGSGADVDFRWEREWRSRQDVNFDFKDVAFGLCPKSEIPYFSKLVNNAFPFVDPMGDAAQMEETKKHLRTFSHLKDLK